MGVALANLFTNLAIPRAVSVYGNEPCLAFSTVVDALGIITLYFLRSSDHSNSPAEPRIVRARESWLAFKNVLERQVTRLALLSTFAYSLLFISTSAFVLIYMPHRFVSKITDNGPWIALSKQVPALVLVLLKISHEGTRTQLANLKLAMFCLLFAILGTLLMAFATSRTIFYAGIHLVSIGISYTLFTKPVLAHYSDEGKRVPIFTTELIIEATFKIFGALLLDWGLQKEISSSVALSFLVVTAACTTCFLLLLWVYIKTGNDENISVIDAGVVPSSPDLDN